MSPDYAHGGCPGLMKNTKATVSRSHMGSRQSIISLFCSFAASPVDTTTLGCVAYLPTC